MSPHVSSVPSVEDRVSSAKRLLTTIAALASELACPKEDVAVLDKSELLKSIYQNALDAHDELYWVLESESEALRTPAPTDDDREDQAKA